MLTEVPGVRLGLQDCLTGDTADNYSRLLPSPREASKSTGAGCGRGSDFQPIVLDLAVFDLRDRRRPTYCLDHGQWQPSVETPCICQPS